MSHSKMTKKGRSYFVEKWNAAAKKFIQTCAVCGKQGYRPSMEEEGVFSTRSEYKAIYAELTKTLPPLALDGLGRCEQCAKIMDE